MKGPGLFSDIGKKAKDLLNKDYSYDQKLTISTFSSTGVGLTSAAVKKGGLYTLDIGTQYKYKNTHIDVKLDTDSNVSTTLTISEVLPYTKTIASLKFPDYKSGKLELQYFHDHASLATAVGLKASPVVDLSGTVGVHGVAFGAEAGYDTASGNFTKYSAGIGGDKGDSLRASYVYLFDDEQKTSVVAEVTRRFSTNDNTFTVGGSYAVDPLTTVKARLNNSGKLAALIDTRAKSILATISGEFDTKALDKPPKFGLALALKP
ncbi:Mitochondrial outer membrane protein porin 5 [Ananas comosus]|uniref:Mitochondrial outer membrane protein porin 5 n=1 Tax=Ananas comosus TaxID=4615 RepID=A0A199W9B8_ANACO|nr:Mitochondrial outer membrane protein porin 5 [Ananas comosus]